MPTISFSYRLECIFISLMFAVLACFALLPQAQQYFLEMSIIENMQLLFLSLSIFYCIYAYFNKNLLKDVGRLFLFIGFIAFCMLSRELNFGVAIVEYIKGYSIKGIDRQALKASIPIQLYKITTILLGLSLIFNIIKHKSYKAIPTIIKTIKIYFFDTLLLCIAIIGAIICEKYTHNTPLEESFECLFYALFLLFTFTYTTNKNNVWRL